MRSRSPAAADPFPVVPASTKPIVEAARRAVLSVARDAEAIACAAARPRSPSMMWKLVRFAVDGETVVTIGTFTRHANMFFARGAELDDPSGVLEGTGKKLRYLTLRTPADARRTAVAKILLAAFGLAHARDRSGASGGSLARVGQTRVSKRDRQAASPVRVRPRAPAGPIRPT